MENKIIAQGPDGHITLLRRTIFSSRIRLRWIFIFAGLALVSLAVGWKLVGGMFAGVALYVALNDLVVDEKEDIAYLTLQALLAQKPEIIRWCGGDQILADRIIRVQRLKLAEARVDHFNKEGIHVCLRLGCTDPVVGERIFAHCKKHLEYYEQTWLKDIETLGSERRFEDAGGVIPTGATADRPLTKLGQEVSGAAFRDRIERHMRLKQQALAEAKKLIERKDLERLERATFLPANLRHRIELVEAAERVTLVSSVEPAA